MSQFFVALLAAVLALAGNAVQLALQDRAKRSGEQRSFTREWHAEAVDTLTDLDLLFRRLRADATAGPRDDRSHQVIEEQWEGGLLRRLRRLKYGHPTEGVRACASTVEEKYLYVIIAAGRSDDNGPPRMRLGEEKRGARVRDLDEALKALQTAVENALSQDNKPLWPVQRRARRP